MLFPRVECVTLNLYVQVRAMMMLQQQTYVKRLDDSSGPASSMAPAMGQSKAGELSHGSSCITMRTFQLFAVETSKVLDW